ncbi:Zinc finger RING/FYVE/PHD-type protein [Dioscorea alata]|uniref:Zinc finger RING/FYVE/PHD-type protein n=1 Tax=Dioscorea alata TaxID=55571 RepID=A0ACB7UZS3_DIOAL|nr:Zinc finger RING/FYVE/PHD-type protein [Dioscorea alata]
MIPAAYVLRISVTMIRQQCQRSSQCPMCWQPINLKDPTSQELLDAVERERRIRSNQTRATTIFHHPAIGEFELPHLPVGASDSELEERIIQHLAAAAAMGREHHRREGQRRRSGSQGRPQFLVFSNHANAPSVSSGSASSAQSRENEAAPVIVSSNFSETQASVGEPPHQLSNSMPTLVDQITVSPPGISVAPSTGVGLSNSRSLPGLSAPVNHDNAGPSDFQSFSESLKSRFNAVSMRYKESITKSTRGWKEKLFSRNTSVADLGSEVRREVNAGIATVSRMMERLDTRDGRRGAASPAPAAPHSLERSSVVDPSSERVEENQTNTIPTERTTCPATTGPN